jgi:hypothetical protein
MTTPNKGNAKAAQVAAELFICKKQCGQCRLERLVVGKPVLPNCPIGLVADWRIYVIGYVGESQTTKVLH